MDSQIKLTVESGIRSLEGTRVSQEKGIILFKTAAPLKMTARNNDYDVWNQFTFQFNNPLEKGCLVEDDIEISPAVDFQFYNRGYDLVVCGLPEPSSHYEVKFLKSIRDVYGQSLDLGSQNRKTGSRPASFTACDKEISIMPAKGQPVYTVATVNYKSFLLKVYGVGLADWEAYRTYRSRHDKKKQMPGELLESRQVHIDFEPNVEVSTEIDLSGHFNQYEFLIVYV